MTDQQSPDLSRAPATAAEHVHRLRREVVDFPSEGIVFQDLTPLLADGDGFGGVVDEIAASAASDRLDAVVGVEARGFPYAAAVARALGVGVLLARKPGKLPLPDARVAFDLEYGSDALEISSTLPAGSRVLVVDDVLATGGTLAATVELCAAVGLEVSAAHIVLELPALGGRDAVSVPLRVVAALPQA